jgi:putative ABC transport system permease protein
LFATVCSIFTAVLVSLAPALDLLPRVFQEQSKEAKYAGISRASERLRRLLAVSEIALSLVLLAGAGLLLKSFWKLTNVNLGFGSKNVVTVRLSLDEDRYSAPESAVAFVESAIEKMAALPGVESAGAGTGIPLIAAGGDRFFTIAGPPIPSNDANKPNAQFRQVTLDYFLTFGIPLLRGRTFTRQDTENSPKVIVINDALARKFFPNEDPIGKVLDIDLEIPFAAQVIGVVQGTRQSLALPPQPEMYVAHKQYPMGYFLLAVRSKIAEAQQVKAIQQALLEIDKDLTFPKFRTMEEIVGQATIKNRVNAILLGCAAGIALLLAAIGIYGVLSFSVEQRKQEIGVRMALGAQRHDIQWLILYQGAYVALIGLLIGIAGTLYLTRLMGSLLFEVSSHDPAVLIAVSVLLATVALLACWIPASRATRVDPLMTLRYE